LRQPPQAVAYFCARVENPCRGAAYDVGVAARARRGAGKRLKEIERSAFARENAAGRSPQRAQALAGADVRAVVHRPRDCKAGVDLAKRFIEPRRAADDGRLARDHVSRSETVRRNKPGGEIAATDVFGQRSPNGGGDVVGKGRHGSRGGVHGDLEKRGQGWANGSDGGRQ
jgi:hypothetical protein